MPKTIYLHIGAHRTGSTAIQAYFSGHRQDFLASGLLYPLAGIPPNLTGHHYVPWLFRRQKNVPALAADSVRTLRREIQESEADSVLISSEDLEEHSFPIGEIVKELELDRYRCVIVLFIRRQDDLIASAYASRVKQGRYIVSLRNFVEAQLKRRRGDFHALLTAWRRALRHAELRTVNYSDPTIASSSVSALCQLLEVAIPAESKAASRRTNISIHPIYLPFLNFLNSAVGDSTEYRRKMIIEPLVQLSAQARRKSVRHYIIEPTQRARIMEAFQKSNAMLADEFLGGVPPFGFDKSEYGGAVHIDPDTVQLSSIVELFRALRNTSAVDAKTSTESGSGDA